MQIELDREEDGRWIAEVPELPGVLCYGATKEIAIQNAQALALRVLADNKNPSPAKTCGELADRWEKLPKLSTEEANAFADDLELARREIKGESNCS
jgi:predicted RNase H-like HicB family nuclease